MEWINYMNDAIDYIEKNITAEIDYNIIAQKASCSVYNFQRLFSFILNMPLSEYIRCRRLTLAAMEIQNSDIKIVDLAIKYGYDSHEAFSRAFYKFHGVVPSAAKKKGVILQYCSRASFKIIISGGIKMHSYITGKESQTLYNIRELLNGMKGHNYGLPDCVKFILERTGWNDEKPDFWDIAAITGDTIAQVYNQNITTSCEYCVSGYLAGPEHIAYVFDTFGYNHEYVKTEQINANKEYYMKKIVEYIEKGIPVLVKTNLNDIPVWESDVGTYCLIVGYENNGQIIKLLFGGTDPVDYDITVENKLDLIFIGEKQREVTLEELYIKAIKKMPHWLTLPECNGMFFGAAAYRKWADDIEAGRFADDNLHAMNWENYGVYVCNLATSGGMPEYIFIKLAEMNPIYSKLAPLGDKIQKLLPNEGYMEGRNMLWVQLEELNAGMDMGQVKKTMRDKEKRSKVAALLRDYADRLDKAVELMEGGVRQL